MYLAADRDSDLARITIDEARKIPYAAPKNSDCATPCLDEVRGVDGEKDELRESEGENEDGGWPPLVLFGKGRRL